MAWAQTGWNLRTIAGGTEAGDGGRAGDASIRFLQGVAVDGSGNIYFSDADDHRVRRVDSQGRIQTLAGDGLAGFSGDGAASTRARVNTPYGLTVMANGDLIFADLGNGRVRRISRSGLIETIAGGGAREIPPAGVWVRGTEVKLVAPRNVLATREGAVFIADFGANRVMELRADGNLTAIPLAATELNAPAGMVLDEEGNLLVADSGNARVRRLRRDGRVDIWLASHEQVPLERPVGLARRADGRVLIADTRGDFLWEVDREGKAGTIVPGGRDVAVDSMGNVVTAGGSWLRRVDGRGLIEILIGNAFSRYRGDGGPALAARLNRPVGVAVDSKGNVYFTDTGNHRVRRVTPEGLITTVAGTGDPGMRGDGGLAAEAFLNGPTYVAVDAFDNVYVADTGNHRVRVFAPGGVIRTLVGTGRGEFSNDGLLAGETSLNAPVGLAFDREGRLYISERAMHRVRRVRTDGRVETVAGTSIRGNGGEGGDALLAGLNAPGALAVDGQGNVYIADAGSTLRVVEGGKIRTLLRDLSGIEGLAATANGVVYLSETGRQRVRRLLVSGDVETIAGRLGENGFNADAGPATDLTLNEPAGLALAPDGSLVLADRLNDRLRRIEPPAAVMESNTAAYRVVHAATYREGAIAPGQLLTMLTGDLRQPELVEIRLDGIAAKVTFANRNQVNFHAPYGIAGRTQVTFELRVGGALLSRMLLAVAAAAPGWFENAGLVVAVFPDGRLNSDSLPARAGDVLTLYGTGEGLLRAAGGMQLTLLPAVVEIGGVAAEVLYAGAAPGFAGLLQVNLRVPENVRLRGRVEVALKLGPWRNPSGQVMVIQ